jgi:hypothetical protein
MKSIALRKEVQQYINRADERFLRMVYSMAKEYAKQDDKVLGYQKGKPIKKKQLIADLEEAERQISQGECVGIDELEKESETW